MKGKHISKKAQRRKLGGYHSVPNAAMVEAMSLYSIRISPIKGMMHIDVAMRITSDVAHVIAAKYGWQFEEQIKKELQFVVDTIYRESAERRYNAWVHDLR